MLKFTLFVVKTFLQSWKEEEIKPEWFGFQWAFAALREDSVKAGLVGKASCPKPCASRAHTQGEWTFTDIKNGTDILDESTRK